MVAAALDQALTMMGIDTASFFSMALKMSKEQLINHLEALAEQKDREGWKKVQDGELEKIVGRSLGEAGKVAEAEGALKQRRGLRDVIAYTIIRQTINIIREL